MKHVAGWMIALGLSMATGCGDEDKGKGGSDQAIGNADCSDPGENPYAEIECVTSFMGACFAPSGMCSGVVDTLSLGKTTLTWESGDVVEATPYYDVSGIDFNDPQAAADAISKSSGADVVIRGAGGSCATGKTRMKQTDASGKTCASQTVYTNNQGQTLTYCFDEAGNGTVACSSNGMTYEVKGGDRASNCQSGSTAQGQCEIEVKMPSGNLPTGQLPSFP